jgi:signal transduction histidine kinase
VRSNAPGSSAGTRVRSPTRADAQAASSSARLELLELYLTHPDDLITCAQASVDWLARYAGIRRSVCLAVDDEARVLMGAAGHGVPRGGVGLFRVPLRNPEDPLVAALRSTAPTTFSASRGNGGYGTVPANPLRSAGFTAIPLRAGEKGGDAMGLLLVRSGVAMTGELLWLSSVLSQQIARFHGHGSTAGEAPGVRSERASFMAVINAVTDPIVLTDADGRLIVTNARAGKLFAAGDDRSEARRAVELNTMLFAAALSPTADGAEPRELLLVDPGDGSDLLFEVLSTTIDDGNEGRGVVSVLRNITDLRRATDQNQEHYQRLRAAESAVRAERDRLNLIIDSVADPIIVTDPGGATVLMNAPAEAIFTAPPDAPDEVIGLVQSNDGRFSTFIAGLLAGASRPGAVRRGELALTSPLSGEAIPVEAIAGRVMSDTGELTAVVTILHDRREALEKAHLFEQLKSGADELQMRVQQATTELATQNELLRRQAIELEQASRLKSQFLANMSHEFRTPLNAILGYTHMLLQGVSGELTPQVKRQLQRIDSNGRHLLTIINEILDITRIEAGKMPMQISEFDLNELVPEVMTELDPVIARSRLRVGVRLSLSGQPPIVHSDRQKVKQIVVNLLSNALKFTHQGSIEVGVRLHADERTASVSVTDTGIGIAPEHQERIFEDFRQVDEAPSRQYGGTGLGLAICRRLAHALRGRISVESHMGKGSTFTLTIPVDVPQ